MLPPLAGCGGSSRTFRRRGPRQDSLHERALALAVGGAIRAMERGQPLLLLEVRGSRLGMTAEVVPEEQMAAPERAVADNRMEMVRAWSHAGLSQIPALGELRLVLPDVLVPVALELGNARLDLGERRDAYHDVDDRLGSEPRHGSASHVLDGDGGIREDSSEERPLRPEPARPVGIVGHEDDGHGSQLSLSRGLRIRRARQSPESLPLELNRVWQLW
jgi:hypothetical protein